MMNERTKFVKQQTGKTIQELAKEIGYSDKTIINALRGRYRAGYDLAKILAEKTGASPLYFMEDLKAEDQP